MVSIKSLAPRNGRNVEDGQQLADLGVSSGATIRLLLRLRGGLGERTREGNGYGGKHSAPSKEADDQQAPPPRAGLASSEELG